MWDLVIAMYAKIIRSGDINCQTSPCLLFTYNLSEGKKNLCYGRGIKRIYPTFPGQGDPELSKSVVSVSGTSGLWTQLPLQLTRSC